MASIIDSSFPTSALVPKTETGVLNFLQKYPEYNGDGATIAIFDSGVDSRATGLQKLLDGSVKVIERFDCSGCGDTDCSKKVTASSDGTIIGLSGRTLKLTDHMKNANKDGNEYRIGLKSLYDLYPSKIREKVYKDVKQRKWDEQQKLAVADVARKLHKLDSQNLDAQNIKDKLAKDDLEQSMEFLNNYEKKFMDVRTTFDCVVFLTEGGYQAIIDTTEIGDLENAVLIGEYSKTHETKNVDDFLSISINVHDEGNVLEIVGMCSSHGTHVASIASGNHSDKELDGVAPNAKIVSLTIGDGRLGSMETGTSLVRAMMKVMELCKLGTKIDVINMSYGEHAHWSHSGRVGELMNEVVNKYGVVWIGSAGNHGPALCTIGTPPDLSQPSCIGVGAYVSPQMMEAEYSMREKLPANVYTWTSRDPCIDGGQGVTVCAPGAAITSVPEFTMMRAQLMNGTSMAAPHVAGAIALLISGLKQKGIKYSPYSIKRAISVTATKLDYVDQFAQGSGLLNVEKAFEYLLQYDKQPENMIRFGVKVGANAKGIHIRQGVLKKSTEFNVTVEPKFFNEKDVAPQDKINFNIRLNLISTHPWVKCGSFLDLCYSARSFAVKIDPVGLSPGVHAAKIKAYDTACIDKGPVFEIPITIVQPHTIDIENSRTFSNSNGILEFKPNTIQRDFILVPNNATWAVLKMCSVNNKDKQIDKFFVHTLQVLPLKYCRALETMKILPVTSENETMHAFKVQENNILELCIAKYWSNFGETSLKYSLEFHGINVTSHSANIMLAAKGIHRIDTTALTLEELSPSLQFKTATQILKPIESKISPLSSQRDVIPAGRQIYQNILTYNLHVTKSQEISLYAPILFSVLYESEFESQFWMLFDSNKMLIACGDAYSQTSYHKLDKGDYTIRLQVRHEKKDYLEKVQEINMLATYKITNCITMDIYEHYNQAIINGKKFSNTSINSNVVKTLYMTPLTSERLTKANLPVPFSWLNGTFILAKDDYGRKVDTQTFTYVMPDGFPVQAKKPNGGANTNGNNNASGSNNGGGNGNGNGSPKKNNKSKTDEYKESLRDFHCAQITKVDLELAEEIYKEVLKNNPKYLPAHLMFIQNLENSNNNKIQLPFAFHKLLQKIGVDENEELKKTTETCKKIVELTNIIINETDVNALLAYYGLKTDTRPDAAKIKTNMDKQKSTLLDALVKKGISSCKLMLIETGKDKEINPTNSCFTAEQIEFIDNLYTEIAKFVDTNDAKVLNFTVWHAFANLHFGRMMKLLQKSYDEKLNRELLDELISIGEVKQWKHIVDMIKKITVSANPMGYRPF